MSSDDVHPVIGRFYYFRYFTCPYCDHYGAVAVGDYWGRWWRCNCRKWCYMTLPEEEKQWE